MICKECGATCGPNARVTLCPACERRLRAELPATLSDALRRTVEEAAANVAIPYVARLIRWFEAHARHAQDEVVRLRVQLEKANQELTAAWGKCEVRRRNSLRYIAEIRRLRATKFNLTERLLRAAHSNIDLRMKIQNLERQPPLTTNIALNFDSYLMDLLDRARNHVTDPVLRAQITAICPPKPRRAVPEE